MNSGRAGDEQFAELLRSIGRDFSLVQGFGGNASVKNEDRTKMLVKSSGKRLGAVDDSDFYHEVTLNGINYIDNIPGQSSRPSIETSFHALLECRFVLHLHSTFGVAISMMSKRAPELRVELQARGIESVDYYRPGRELSQGIGSQKRNQKSLFLLLRNHGIVVGADSVFELEDKTLSFEDWASHVLSLRQKNLISPADIGAKITIAAAERAHWHALNNWRITPDHCVFLGAEPEKRVLETLLSARASEQVFGYRSTERDSSLIGEQLGFFHNLSQALPRQVFDTLSREEAQFLCGWEAERFRIARAEGSVSG